MKTIHDAPHLNDFADPIRVSVSPQKSFPIRQDLSAIDYRIEYAQRSEFFRPAPLGLVCPDDYRAKLYTESDPTDLGNGLVTFSRSYSTTPGIRYEFENGSFTFPAIRSTSSSASVIRSNLSRQVVFKVQYSYTYTDDPEGDLVVSNQFQPIDENGNFVSFIASDTIPTSAEYQTKREAGEYIQATETEFSRWKGNIWELKNKLVLIR